MTRLVTAMARTADWADELLAEVIDRCEGMSQQYDTDISLDDRFSDLVRMLYRGLRLSSWACESEVVDNAWAVELKFRDQLFVLLERRAVRKYFVAWFARTNHAAKRRVLRTHDVFAADLQRAVRLRLS